ncbi:MAG: glycerol-3-phosphate 1-O-acyltransferase PlsY [Planctomycetes bacterium]|nr:glycerol-3-phosphate 1-O-acyltransferase PlsY [Planctomycetota bacterium]
MTAPHANGLFWSCVAAGYLIGAIPVGYLAAMARGINIRDVGSGNIGATNVGRALGRTWGRVVLFIDIAKGLFVSGLAPFLLVRFALLPHDKQVPLAASAGLAAVLGHIYPVYLLFRGGKGVATTVGVYGGLLGPWLVIPLLAYSLAVKITDYVSVGSIAFAVCLPITAWLAYRSSSQHYWVWGTALVVSVFVLWRHRGNINRLLHGIEPRRSGSGGHEENAGSVVNG